jgi:hypothetical protein
MGNFEDEIRKLGNGAQARLQIAELKEVLRRMGRSQSGDGQGQAGDGQGTNLAQNGNPDGKDGKSGSKSGKGKGQGLMRDFNDRAGGTEKMLMLGGEGGKESILLPLPGQGDPKPGQGGGNEPGQSKDGIGDQHDPNARGDATSLAAKHQSSQLSGKQGAGPSRSATILGSAEHGFASRDYKTVYRDYSQVVEGVMSKERVPPGYRYYIKRYFQLIKPRE